MHSIDPVWEEGSDRLDFQSGPYTLRRVPLKVLALQTNAFVASPDLEVPLDEAIRQGYQAAVKYGTPINLNFPAIRIQGGSLRYVPRYGHRYVVDLEGSFREYLRKFSKKARGNLQRTVKKIVQASGGFADFREYRSPSEIMAFRDIAIAISRRSYKKDIGWGFQEGEDFARRLESDAASGTVRGYVLVLDGEPAAYVFCRIDHDVIVYKHIGYDDRFAEHSPGTALLYLLLERLSRNANSGSSISTMGNITRTKNSSRPVRCDARASCGFVQQLETLRWSSLIGSSLRLGALPRHCAD